jgi:Cys-rich repeat protein
VAFTGCPKAVTPTTDAGRANECETRADCPSGKVCTSNNFCDTCSTSGQCTVKEQCQADTGLCALRAGWGTDCALNDDCQAGSWCMQGLCKDRSQVSLCPTGSSADCGQGLRCNPVTTVCEEDLGCSTDDDCSAGQVCNAGSRQCVPRCTADTQATVCAAGERCLGAYCVQCASNAECGVGLVCDAAGECSAGTRCYTDRDCMVPLVCLVQTGACLPRSPPCSSDDACAVNQRCDVSSGACVPRTCQPDRYEPDDSAAQAFNVAPGSYPNLTLCSADTDWYAIALSRGDQLGVNLDADPFAENTFSTQVKDVSGRTVASGKLLVSYVAPLAAKYFVEIRTTDAFQPYGVTFLKSRGIPCDDDAHEPNDSASQPTLLNASSGIDGVICPQDQDWFKLTVPDGHDVTLSLANYDSGKGLLQLCAYAADGVGLYGCSDDPAPSVSVSAARLTSATVLVQVLGESDRIANAYTLDVAF